MLSIGATGISEALTNLARTQELAHERIDDAVQRAAVNCQEYAQAICPVDTGEMRDGFEAINNGPLSSSTINDVLHSLFVELGTIHMAAQPTLYPAFLDASQTLIEECHAI